MDKPKPFKTKDITKNISLAFIGIISFFLMILITNKWGVGFSPDSAGYLAGARNIINGNGISLLYDSMGDPIILWLPWGDNEAFHLFPWPPFFPMILSIFGFIKLNIVESGRFLNAALFGANIFLVTFIVKKYLKSTFLMVFAAIILITSSYMIRIHSMFWSEPLFIFLSLSGILFLIYFLEKNKILFLLIASLFFGLAFFTRTVGISLIAVSAVTVLLYSDIKIKNKIIYSALSILIGIIPFSIWTLINRLNYGPSQLEFIYHPGRLEFYFRMLGTISLWVMPEIIPESVRVILLIAIIITIILIVSYIAFQNKKKYMDKQYRLNSKIIGIFLFYILFYFITLLSARYFYNVAVNISSSRFLLPALISIFIVSVFFLKRFLDFYNNIEYMKIIAYIFCGFLIITSLINNNAIEKYKDGEGYNNQAWHQSETIRELKEIQQLQIPVYTNDPAAVYFFLGKSSNILPVRYNVHTGRTNSNYENDLDNIIEEIKEEDGLLVFFDNGWGIFPKEEVAHSDNRFYLYKDTSDGAIFRIKN